MERDDELQPGGRWSRCTTNEKLAVVSLALAIAVALFIVGGIVVAALR